VAEDDDVVTECFERCLDSLGPFVLPEVPERRRSCSRLSYLKRLRSVSKLAVSISGTMGHLSVLEANEGHY